jgi:N-acetylglucosaminyl-diphospho-decaprenol L-rhamnosyltransferase
MNESSYQPTSTTRLGVVVVNYESADLLRQHLVGAVFPDGTEIVVVDNSTSSLGRRELREVSANQSWTVLNANENVGFGKAVNMGAAALIAEGCSVLLLLNPDAWISIDNIEKLVAIHESDPLAIVAPHVKRADGRPWFEGAVINNLSGLAVHSFDSSRSPEWLTAACLLVPTRVWDELGGIDGAYFLYWEDVDLTYRWRQCGGTLRVVPDIEAFHSVGGTQSAGGKSISYLYFNCRNRLVFASKNISAWRTFGWVITSPYQWRLLLREAGFRHSRQKFEILKAILGGTIMGVFFVVRNAVSTAKNNPAALVASNSNGES